MIIETHFLALGLASLTPLLSPNWVCWSPAGPRAIRRNYPKDTHVKVVSLNQEVLGRFAGTLVLLFGSVVLLLLVGCGNVSIMLLARGSARARISGAVW